MVSANADEGLDTDIKHHVGSAFNIQEVLGRGEQQLREVTRRDEELSG